MVYKYAVRHHIVILCYYGIINSGIVLSKDIFDRFKSAAYKHIYISNNQLFEISRIKKAFDVEKISYCFLKGSILKSKYQKAELRYMGDADVLIRSEQYEKITEILKSMGYEEVQGKGSGVKFIDRSIKHVINLHKPHPGNIIKGYLLNQIKEKLEEVGKLWVRFWSTMVLLVV